MHNIFLVVYKENNSIVKKNKTFTPKIIPHKFINYKSKCHISSNIYITLVGSKDYFWQARDGNTIMENSQAKTSQVFEIKIYH